jgi:esterase/lipase
MSDYSMLVAAIAQKTKAHEDGLSLLNDGCRSQFFLQSEPSQKVFLFFHGFTATPAQFVPIGKTFYKMGYNVIIPLLPGHGLAGDWNGKTPPPLPEDQKVYQEFGQYWLQQIQDLGEEIIVGGLSGGANLAAWLAIESPQLIDRALLFAPYFSSGNVIVDCIVQTLDIYFKWRTKPGQTHYGYKGFFMPSLRVFVDMGQEILKRIEIGPAVPMLIISSGSDRAASKTDHQRLFRAVLQHQSRSWYHCFHQKLDMPHTMMTRAEGNDCLDLLIAVTRAYIESDLTWSEVQEISDRVRQGQCFEATIAELNLGRRASPDLLSLVTTDRG